MAGAPRKIADKVFGGKKGGGPLKVFRGAVDYPMAPYAAPDVPNPAWDTFLQSWYFEDDGDFAREFKIDFSSPNPSDGTTRILEEDKNGDSERRALWRK